MQSGSVIMKTRHTSRKCNKVSDGERKNPSVDRLSALSDDIICHILSFLSTKQSVATSILARRWRFLWKYVSDLGFGSDIFNSSTGFSNIVNKVMKLHKLQSIKCFQLFEDSESDCSEYDLDSWITTAIDRNVQYLDLYFDRERSITLPRCLFTCKTLVDVCLYCCRGIPSVSSGSIYLPNLKKLCLEDIDYEVEEALPHLLSGCPVLEELIVITYLVELGCLNISSTSIKRLEVNSLFACSQFDDPQVMLIINAPALVHFTIGGFSYENFSISSITTSLVEVSIQLSMDTFDARDCFYNCHQVLNFLDRLSSMKRLKLVGRGEEFTRFGEIDSHIKFNNLVKLELTADWQFLPKFFERAGNLEILIIREGYKCPKNGMGPTESHCACLLYFLKTVTIHGFRCTEQEFNAVSYILGKAPVLKRMEIYFQHNVLTLGARFDAFQEISLLKPQSGECELVFS